MTNISFPKRKQRTRHNNHMPNLIPLSAVLLLVFRSSAAVPTSSLVKERRLPPLRPWGVSRSSITNRERIEDIDVQIVKEKIPSANYLNPTLASRPSDSPRRPRRIIVMGGPASGKGTQCELIKKKYGVVHLSTGDMLRAAVSKESSSGSIGALAKKYMDAGKLVPDKTIIDIVKDRISQPDCVERGYLLDGFPRTRAQAKALIEMGIKPDTFLFIEVPDKNLVERVVGRRLDPVTGKIYHLLYNPPKEEIMGRLVTRSDDTEDKARSRLHHFHQNANAVKECFDDVMVVIDGTGTPSEVAKSIENVLEERKKCAA